MKLLKSIDEFAVRRERVFRYVLLLLLVVLVLMSALLFWEYVDVGILGHIEGYPWGCKCFPGMEIYATPATYAAAELQTSLLLALASLISTLFVMRHRSIYALFALIAVMLVSALYHYMRGY